MPALPDEAEDPGHLPTGVMATHDSPKRQTVASSPSPLGAMPARSASAGFGGHRYDGHARTRPAGPRQDLSVMETHKLSTANSRLPARHFHTISTHHPHRYSVGRPSRQSACRA